MGQFNGMKLTNKGQTLQAKAQAGTMLQFTRLAIGDGNLGSTDPLTLNALISQKKSLQVKKLESLTGGKAVVGSSFTNADVTTGFDMRELGVFAQDPDVGEILYMYGNAGNTADFIPPGSGGGSDVLERALNVVTIVGTAANVTAVIDQSLVFATAAQLGDLSKLKTTAKGSAVDALNELFTSASDGKSAVAAAVTGKGVAASSSDTFATLSTKIGNISKDATAAPGDVLAGKTYYKDLKQTGTMPDRGTGYVSPSASQQTLPAGYYSSIVTFAVSFDPTRVLAGTTIAGTAGTMPNRGTANVTPTASQQTLPLGYYTSIVTNAVSFDASKLLVGTTVAGTAGTMPNRGALNVTPTQAQQTFPAGYYSSIIAKEGYQRFYTSVHRDNGSSWLSVNTPFRPKFIFATQDGGPHCMWGVDETSGRLIRTYKDRAIEYASVADITVNDTGFTMNTPNLTAAFGYYTWIWVYG